MLIELHNCLADCLTDTSDPNAGDRARRFAAAMHNLTRVAHGEGKHVVTGSSKRLLRALAANVHLADDARGAFRGLITQYQEAQALREDEIYSYIQVHDDVTECRSCERPWNIEDCRDGRRCFHVSYLYFEDSEQSQSAALVAENLDDARLYNHAADAYLADRRLRGLRVAVRPVGGGGNTTAAVASEQAVRQPTLAIVDSDRAAPELPVKQNSTAQRTVRSIDERLLGHEPAIVHCHVLPCRELENLLPLALLRESVPAGYDQSALEHAQRVGALAGQEDVRFIDLKNGWTLCDAFESEHDTQRELARRVMAHCPRPRRHGARGFCTQECERPEECLCVLVPPLGTHLVEWAAQRAARQTAPKLAESLLCGPCYEVWETVVRYVLSFGCAHAPVRAA